jgi:Cys-tRNA synthase (O-phospho-L-seryl-tRNA:Cys-tRNA synthase)
MHGAKAPFPHISSRSGSYIRTGNFTFPYFKARHKRWEKEIRNTRLVKVKVTPKRDNEGPEKE